MFLRTYYRSDKQGRKVRRTLGRIRGYGYRKNTPPQAIDNTSLGGELASSLRVIERLIDTVNQLETNVQV